MHHSGGYAKSQIERYKRRPRAAFSGMEAQFTAAWPEILRRWQIAQVEGGESEAIARKGASGMY